MIAPNAKNKHRRIGLLEIAARIKEARAGVYLRGGGLRADDCATEQQTIFETPRKSGWVAFTQEPDAGIKQGPLSHSKRVKFQEQNG